MYIEYVLFLDAVYLLMNIINTYLRAKICAPSYIRTTLFLPHPGHDQYISLALT